MPDRVQVNLEQMVCNAPNSLALFYYLASNPRVVEPRTSAARES